MLHLNLRISLCFMAIFYGKVCVTNAFSPKCFSPKRVVFAVKGHGMLLCVECNKCNIVASHGYTDILYFPLGCTPDSEIREELSEFLKPPCLSGACYSMCFTQRRACRVSSPHS